MIEEQAELSVTRRQIEERLAELEPDSEGSEGAKPSFKREPLFLRLQLGVLDLFERVARELGPKARLEVIRHDPPAPEISVRLSPANPGAARVEAFPDAEDTVYLGLGVAGWVETLGRQLAHHPWRCQDRGWEGMVFRGCLFDDTGSPRTRAVAPGRSRGRRHPVFIRLS
jgi:hypothetical protein